MQKLLKERYNVGLELTIAHYRNYQEASRSVQLGGLDNYDNEQWSTPAPRYIAL